MENNISIDGDFRSQKGDCHYHCSPSCHPAQVGPEWVYGCTHPAWPQNKHGDFCPIVDCGGFKAKCELKGMPFIGRYRGGLRRRMETAQAKLVKYSTALSELEELFDT